MKLPKPGRRCPARRLYTASRSHMLVFAFHASSTSFQLCASSICATKTFLHRVHRAWCVAGSTPWYARPLRMQAAFDRDHTP